VAIVLYRSGWRFGYSNGLLFVAVSINLTRILKLDVSSLLLVEINR
jgi:hypothetical protein